MLRALAALTIIACAAVAARAEVKTKDVVYEHNGAKMTGYLAWDDAAKGKRPGVLVVHEFWGLNDYAKKRAEQLAGLGYVAFAADIYAGKLTDQAKEASALAGAMRKDPETWMGRANAALKVLRDDPKVDGKKLASMGYCFGGTTSLMLAHTGADIQAAISFHGALVVPESPDKIKAKILICHGALDSFIPEETIQKTRAAYESGKVDYQMVYYSGAVHSFTVREADKRGMKGVGYDERADRRSWEHMQLLLSDVFGNSK